VSEFLSQIFIRNLSIPSVDKASYSYTVGLRFTDSYGESDTDLATVTLSNVAPTVSDIVVKTVPDLQLTRV
jgi:hypothetical protein